MQMRRAQLPQNCHGQGLAATGIAKTLRRVLLSLFNTQNCRRVVIPSEARNLTIGSVITLDQRLTSTQREILRSTQDDGFTLVRDPSLQVDIARMSVLEHNAFHEALWARTLLDD